VRKRLFCNILEGKWSTSQLRPPAHSERLDRHLSRRLICLSLALCRLRCASGGRVFYITSPLAPIYVKEHRKHSNNITRSIQLRVGQSQSCYHPVPSAFGWSK